MLKLLYKLCTQDVMTGSKDGKKANSQWQHQVVARDLWQQFPVLCGDRELTSGELY